MQGKEYRRRKGRAQFIGSVLKKLNRNAGRDYLDKADIRIASELYSIETGAVDVR